MLWFVIRFTIHTLTARSGYELLIVSTIPPIALPLACRLITAVRGGDYLIHGLDLYPEIARQAGLLRSESAFHLLQRIDAANYEHAQASVVLSDDMRRSVGERGCRIDDVHVINNMILADGVDPDEPLDGRLAPSDGRFRLTFAGNLGRFQGLEHVVEAVSRLAHLPIQLAFMGDGKLRTQLEVQAAEHLGDRIVFHDFQPLDVATRFVAQSDLALITLAPGVIQYAYPSKLMTTLRAGTRVLAVVEQDSELAQLVKNQDLGRTCPSGDVDALERALVDEYCRRESEGAESDRIRAMGEQLFGRETILKKWSTLIAELEKEQ